jgi:hypothetical protein
LHVETIVIIDEDEDEDDGDQDDDHTGTETITGLGGNNDGNNGDHDGGEMVIVIDDDDNDGDQDGDHAGTETTTAPGINDDGSNAGDHDGGEAVIVVIDDDNDDGDHAGDECGNGNALPRCGETHRASINDSGAEAVEPSPDRLASNQTCIANTEIQQNQDDVTSSSIPVQVVASSACNTITVQDPKPALDYVYRLTRDQRDQYATPLSAKKLVGHGERQEAIHSEPSPSSLSTPSEPEGSSPPFPPAKSIHSAVNAPQPCATSRKRALPLDDGDISAFGRPRKPSWKVIDNQKTAEDLLEL